MTLKSGSFKRGVHSFDIRVYYEDTDAGGVVYHANYAKFAERARTEFLRYCEVQQEQLKALYSCVFVVTRLNIKYKKSARLDDVIQVRTALETLSKTSLTLTQELWIKDELIVEMQVFIVSLDVVTWKLKRVPEEIFEKLEVKVHG